jgi:hypothetical protein
MDDEAPVNENASEEAMDTIEEDEEALTHKAIRVLDHSDTLATTTSAASSTKVSIRNQLDRRLSVVSSKYDLEGRGELNDAEQASKWLLIVFQHTLSSHHLTHIPLSSFICISTVRNLDSTGRGYLTNDKVYALMNEQIKLQKDVFQMKKIIIGYV